MAVGYVALKDEFFWRPFDAALAPFTETQT